MKQILNSIFFSVAFLLLSTIAWGQKGGGNGTSNPGLNTVNQCQLFVPNAFTPNGDNINDRFTVKYNGDCILAEFRMKAFDRWGRLVFEAESADEALAWDGTSRGRELKEGVYMWRVYAKLVDPAKGYEAQIVNEQGTVVLIR